MHPTDEKLIEYLDGVGAGNTRRHLKEGCPKCSSRLELIQALISTMRSDRDADPPLAWVDRAIGLRTAEVSPGIRERLREWIGDLSEQVARVVSDSCAFPGDLALAGMRSVGGARRLRFETASVELDLQIEADVGTAILTGQFVTAAASPAPIGNAPFVVVAGDGDPIHGTTDGLGEFSVDAPVGAELQLRLRYDDEVVRFVVPPELPPVS